MPIEDDDTEEFINGVLYQKIYSSDLACIPSIYYEYIKNYGWKLKDMIDLHRFLKESEGKEKITEKTKCPICLSNFGFGWDTPMKLSCSEANHAVCLKCFSSAGSNFRCPLDNKECEMSNPTPLEVDDLFSYPWCRGCNEIMGKNQNIPVKSKCIHPMCKECSFCKICKDYVIEDKNVIDKNLSKKLEFMETYCLEHGEPAIKFKKVLWEIPLHDIEIRTFPKVCCSYCKGGTFILRNKDYFKMFDSSVQYTFYCLVENLSRLDIRYQEIAEEWKSNFLIFTYNQRLEKIQEIAQILEG
ncbi:unnamed protein product [Blepharisma stoltei]|uniref:RING-type domain-containing protein n=1 Tax=Blepharisma stoltei TaxID=1481888 RepID=A0AAU9JMH6_9CILI|nr:unnamed protein product [Blepharisma stoltei]